MTTYGTPAILFGLATGEPVGLFDITIYYPSGAITIYYPPGPPGTDSLPVLLKLLAVPVYYYYLLLC